MRTRHANQMGPGPQKIQKIHISIKKRRTCLSDKLPAIPKPCIRSPRTFLQYRLNKHRYQHHRLSFPFWLIFDDGPTKCLRFLTSCRLAACFVAPNESLCLSSSLSSLPPIHSILDCLEQWPRSCVLLYAINYYL